MQDQEVIMACSPDPAQKALVIWHVLVEPDTAFEAR
jgi:hypothetical protein